MEKRFPEELSRLPNWLCWRLEQDKRSGRDCKVPYSPHGGHRASASNPATWGTLDEALFCAEKYLFSGTGFVFSADCGIVGIDIDHCLEDGKLNDIAADILAHLPPTYIEISPSGKGLHIFLRGVLPPGGNKNSKTGVEMYSTNRYFTMTGNRWRDCADEIAADDGCLEYIHRKYVSTSRKSKQNQPFQKPTTLSDSELLQIARASNSKDGGEFEKLWQGDWQPKFKSQSEADFALCRKLAFWSGRDEGQMDRLFRQSSLFREKWDVRHSANGLTYGQQTVQNACRATESIYSPAQKKEPEIFRQGNCYFRRKGDKFYPITNFVVEPIEMICAEEEAQLTCNFITEKGEKFPQALTSGDFSTVQKFKGVLNKRTIALSFLGGEGDLELFKTHIYDLDWVKKRGVKALGIYLRDKRFVFVDSKGAVSVGGRRVNNIVQIEKYRCLESGILQAGFLDKTGLQLLAEHILRYNEPAKTVPILAWAAACFIKPQLRFNKVKFPHLFLIGEAGSGKSNTLERIILPIFSRSKVSASSQVTGFTLMKESASSNVIPQALDEFKPSKLDKLHLNWLYNHFRDSYDYHEGVRGRADQTQTTYDLLAPIVVAGEESADESAIRERTVELLFSKKDIRQPGCRESFVWLSGSGKLLQSLGRSLLDTSLATTPAEADLWFDEGKSFLPGELPLRVLDNLCCLYCGLSLLAKLFQNLGAAWNSVIPYDHETCIRFIEFAAKEYLLDGGMNNKAIVEQTFEIMARMNLKQGVDYAFENNGQYLCLCLGGVYDRFTRYKKDCAIVGEVLSLSQFQRQLSHSEFFIEKSRLKRMGEEIRRVWVVDFAVLSKRCDVSGFVRETAQEPPPSPPCNT